MSEELQSLLDKIQAEGVDKANARASEIVADAERKAAGIVADAEKKAAALRAAAEADAETLKQRAEQSLAQAGRDVKLQVSQFVQQTLERILLGDVRATLRDPNFLGRYAEGVARAFSEGAEFRVPEEDAEALAAYLRSRLASEAAAGVRVAPDSDVTSGIRVMVQDGRVEHDFTAEAVAEALARVVRPSLAKLAFGK